MTPDFGPFFLWNWPFRFCDGGLLHFKDTQFCQFSAPDRTVQSGDSLEINYALYSRFVDDRDQRKEKPGREVVTFLLICNLAMWAINTKNNHISYMKPCLIIKVTFQVDFYGGEWIWPIITHMSMPLAIFYRFHSTVCLCEIWSNAYQ